MVLSSADINCEIDKGQLEFDPPIADDQIGSSAIDLLLHEQLYVLPRCQVQGVIAAPSLGMDIMLFVKSQSECKSIANGTYDLQPHHLVLGRTVERLVLPKYLAARVEGKSSIARLGLSVHMTAPTVMAGFRGYLFLEMYNAGPFAIQLSHRMKIAQLILERLETPPDQGYRGQYQDQS